MTFITFGLIFIFFLFGVVKGKSLLHNALILLSCMFVLVGYFYGSLELSTFAINGFHFFAALIFLFLFFDKRVVKNLHFILLFIFIEVLALYLDSDFLMFYGGGLLFALLSILFVLFHYDYKLLVSLLSLFSFLFLIVDGYFQFYEMGYVYIDFDLVFLAVFFLYGLSRIFVYVDNLYVANKEFSYEKK